VRGVDVLLRRAVLVRVVVWDFLVLLVHDFVAAFLVAHLEMVLEGEPSRLVSVLEFAPRDVGSHAQLLNLRWYLSKRLLNRSGLISV